MRLDTGCDVLVHRDEHWLVRDLALQREGVRIGADGTRCLGEFSTNLNANPGFNPSLTLTLTLTLILTLTLTRQVQQAAGRWRVGGGRPGDAQGAPAAARRGERRGR